MISEQIPVRQIPASSGEEHIRCCSGCVPRRIVQFNSTEGPADTTYRNLFEPGWPRGRTISGTWCILTRSRSIKAAAIEPPSGAETTMISDSPRNWQYSSSRVSIQSGNGEVTFPAIKKEFSPLIQSTLCGWLIVMIFLDRISPRFHGGFDYLWIKLPVSDKVVECDQGQDEHDTCVLDSGFQGAFTHLSGNEP